MRVRFIALASLVAFSLPAKAEGDWRLAIGAEGRGFIEATNRASKPPAPNLESLLGFIEKLTDEQRESLDGINLMWFFLNDSKVQKELLAQFKKDHPDALRAALASAGNSHNPKVRPLRAIFPEALLKTPTIKKISQHLGTRDSMVLGVSHEKFSIDKTKDPVRFFSFVRLTFTPKVDRK